MRLKENFEIDNTFIFGIMDLFMNQSNYIPWKGYFDNIASADIFVVYDHVQYTRHDWRNRNTIKTTAGLKWLTIPIVAKGFTKKISETIIADEHWQKSHLAKIKQAYAKAEYFNEMIGWIEDMYLTATDNNLSNVNIHFLQGICAFLQIKTQFINSNEITAKNGDRNESIVNICKFLGVDNYLVGPAAKNYIDENIFLKNGIQITFADYGGYQTYPQLFPPFEHHVSILDLIFNCGSNSINYMKHVPKI